MRRLLTILISGLAMAMATTASVRAQKAGDLTVFAAASLTNALEEISAAFENSGGAKVRFSFAASSTLAKQIEAGAGAQLFVSADEGWMTYLEQRGRLVAGSRRPIVGNSLVLVVPADRTTSLEIAADGRWLDALPAGRIATGDPAHVPVGKYAQQALTRLGAWGKVEPRLARADNVRNALVLVERGEAAAGIVYGTDAAVSKQVAVAGVFPEGSHDAIVYPAALIGPSGDNAEATRFLAFLSGPAARQIFVRHGFTIPGSVSN